jgi:hypothetical protein
MPAQVKIFGERNTATNAVSQFLARNSASRIVPGTARAIDPSVARRLAMLDRLPFAGRLREHLIDSVFRSVPPYLTWKHAATNFEDVAAFDGMAVVILIRHPASWVFALNRRPYHDRRAHGLPLSRFVYRGWRTVGRERLGRRTFTPLALYEEKVRHYFDFADRLGAAGIPCRIMRFESFCQDQLAFFDALRPLLAEPASTPEPVRAGTKEPGRDWTYYRDYYGAARWVGEIPVAVRETLNARIDWSLFAPLGYGPLSTSDGAATAPKMEANCA